MAKIFIELVTIFCERPETKFSSRIFCNALNARLPRSVFTWWWTKYSEREHPKQVLKTRIISITLLIIVALILKVVRK